MTVNGTGCGFRTELNISYFHSFALALRQNVTLSSTTHHIMPPEFGGKLGAEGLTTGFLLPPLHTYKNIYIYPYQIKYAQLPLLAHATHKCKRLVQSGAVTLLKVLEVSYFSVSLKR